MSTLYVLAFVVMLGLAILNASLAGVFRGRAHPSVGWARLTTLVGAVLLLALVLVDLIDR